MRDEGGGVHGHRKDLDGLSFELEGVHGAVGMDPLHEKGRQFIGTLFEGLDGDGRPDVQEAGVVGLDLLDLQGVHLPHGQGKDVLHEGIGHLREGQDRAVGHVVQFEAVQQAVAHQDGIPLRDRADERAFLEDDPPAGVRRGGVTPRFLGRRRSGAQEQGEYAYPSFHRLWKRDIRFLT